MAWFLGQSLFIIIGSIALGVLIGWLLWGRVTRVAVASAGSAVETTPAPRPEPVERQPAEPQAVAAEPEPIAAEAVVAETESEPEPVAAEPEHVEPEPIAAEPVAAEPEPVAAEPEHVEPEPIAAEPVGPEPVAGKPEPIAAEPVAAELEPEPVAAQALEPEPVRDDDLERVEGIGPKMAGALRQAGIRSYAQLAAADESALRQAIADAGLSFAPSLPTWARQAKLLADGDEEGFADLVRRLVAGRDVGRP